MDKKEPLVHDPSPECNNYNYQHPDFKVLLTRKFELSELCEIFFNKWGKYLYLIAITLVSILFAWSLATVVGSAWAINIPLNFGPFQQCSYDAFKNKTIPGLDDCRFTYYFCLMLFASVIVPLCLLDLKEQVILQMIFGLVRVMLISMLLIYCIVNLIHKDSVCELQGNVPADNDSNASQGCYILPADNDSNPINASQGCYIELYNILFKFDWNGWLAIIPTMMYCFMVQHTIPTLTHPVKEKKYLRWLLVCSLSFVMLCYLSLGVVLPLWFRDETQETLTLSWVRRYTAGSKALL